ncbi:MAG: hypothetical protein U9O94_02965 [Nanoarchaeota archaeon]|nr:hypothetical protein [Nanoarchaeota archaeon]
MNKITQKDLDKESMKFWGDMKADLESDLPFLRESIALRRNDLKLVRLYKESMTNVLKGIEKCNVKIKQYKSILINSSQ